MNQMLDVALPEIDRCLLVHGSLLTG